MNDERASQPLGDPFDRTVRGLEGVPGTVKTSPATLRVIHQMTGVTQTYIVQTYRQTEDGEPSRDTILIEFSDQSGHYRLAFPAKVADTIARQREALTAKNRSRVAKARAADRKARGPKPERMKD